MASPPTVDVVGDQIVVGPNSDAQRSSRKRRWGWRVLIGSAVLLVVVVLGAVLWFVFGREQPRQVSDATALEQFQQSAGAGSSPAAGGPPAGVYSATAAGSESIGVPGLDERLGSNAPVRVTHEADGCFMYRVDFNDHHWRSWTFCPTPDTTFALTGLQSWTYRKAPGVTVDSLGTYVCETPIGYLWPEAAAGETRQGSCTGTASDADGVTADEGTTEVLGRTTLTIAGQTVDVVNVRSSDVLSGAQTGTEIDEWWLDATTGLPVKIVTDVRVKISGSDYRENATLELADLVPAT